MNQLRFKSKNSPGKILERIDVGIVCVDDKDFKILYANSQMETLTLWAKEKMLDKTIFDFFPQDLHSRIVALFELTPLQDGPLSEKELLLIKKTGELCNVTVATSHVDEEGYRLLTITDNTPRKELEKKLDLAFFELVENSKFRSLAELSAGIAHEINNPLAIIMMLAEQLEMFVDNGELNVEQLLKCTSTLKSTSLRIATIIKNLKMLSRNSISDQFVPINVKQLINDCLELSQKKIAKNVKIDVVWPVEDLIFEGNHGLLIQVLLNLLDNAAFAALKAQPSWIKLEVKELPSKVQISVENSGPLIPKALRTKILQPFFTTKEVGAGTGLGLSLSKSIVEQHKGQLILDDSRPHTCFTITLPRVMTPEKKHDEERSYHLAVNNGDFQLEKNTESDSMLNKEQLSLLVVDDEQEIVSILASGLESAGFTVFKAFSVEDAMGIIQAQKIDLVISDIRLPQKDGFELLKWIKNSQYHNIKVIFVTGSVDIPLDLAFSGGIEAVLPKPVIFKEILDAVHWAIMPREKGWKRKSPRLIRDTKRLQLEYYKNSMGYQLVNIGLCGMFVAIKDQLPSVGDYIKFTLKIHDDQESHFVTGTGIVRWLRSQVCEGLPKGAGIEFHSISNNSLTALMSFLSSVKRVGKIPKA